MKAASPPAHPDATRDMLIDKAETLFASAGIDGVSARQIGAAIGSANTGIVAYYFGKKEGLVQAIFERRLSVIDARRAEMLHAADLAGKGHDLTTLLDVMFRPFLEQTNSEGLHSYASFLDGVLRSNRLDVSRAIRPNFQVSNIVILRLATACGRKVDRLFNAYLQMCLSMVTTATQIIDHWAGDEEQAHLIEDALRMVEAALRAMPADGDEVLDGA